MRQHCDESHHQGGQASNQVCTKTPNRRRRQHRTARFEDTQVSGEMSHDAAADTSLAPLPGRAPPYSQWGAGWLRVPEWGSRPCWDR